MVKIESKIDNRKCNDIFYDISKLIFKKIVANYWKYHDHIQYNIILEYVTMIVFDLRIFYWKIPSVEVDLNYLKYLKKENKNS